MRTDVLVGAVLSAAVICGTAAPQPAPAAPRRLATIDGFATPESVRYDPERDRYLVSNVNAHATRADNNGFISWLAADGTVVDRRFIAGGQRGVTLHAPKGMVLRGAQLWVTDVTAVRSFDRSTGAPGPMVDLGTHGAVFLNDITAAPDGALLVSDTSFIFADDGKVTRGGTDRIYRIDRSGGVTVAVADARLEGPNGVFWDVRGDRLLIASIAGRHVHSWTAADGLALVATGPGGYDGIESLADGTIVVSSQDLPGVLWLDGSTLRPLITGVGDTGDIGVDPGRHRIAIPRLGAHVVELWQLAR
jgi:sugar lactone lactonase YvrE